MTMKPDDYIGKRASDRTTNEDGVILDVHLDVSPPTAKFLPDSRKHNDAWTWLNLSTLRMLDSEETPPGDTTRIGYKNRNGQVNLGPLNLPGTDHNQMLYRMRCEACQLEYAANGTDIFQRRCPHCQDGAPSTGGWEP